MHARDIDAATFEAIAAELDQIERGGYTVEFVRGRHEDHGEVMMVRSPTECIAMVEEPAFLDQMLGVAAEAAPATDGAVLARAMRAGRG